VFCQLETLRHCLPSSVRHTLDELPESLDDTYERILREIKKPNRDHAHRLLQCLVVAIRPLGVDELAEVLAVDFDDAEGIPRLNPEWRWEDEEQALLTSCSSLIAIVETDYSKVVQFSHFSVKEFLTSTRLAGSSKDLSRYHIDLEPAHVILAQACIGILLKTDDRVEENGVGKSSSLAEYAARHWVIHGQFKSVSSSLRKAMEYLFDPDMPYFAAWLKLHDIDIIPTSGSSSLSLVAIHSKFNGSPLYYAALCGFQFLVEHLVVKNPRLIKTSGGYYMTPLVAALAGRHFQTAEFLHHSGAHLDVRGTYGYTLLNSAALYGDVEMVQVLLDYQVDVNARDDHGWTPLHDVAVRNFPSARLHNVVQSSLDVAQILLGGGADVNPRSNDGRIPLHQAAMMGSARLVRMLLKHGANVAAEDKEGRTPLHEAAKTGSAEVVRMLLEHGANVAVQDEGGITPLHRAAETGSAELVRMLLDHGANVEVEDKRGGTPLHRAAETGSAELVRVLVEHGANVAAEDKEGITPLHRAAAIQSAELVRMLLEHGADVNARTNDYWTPLLIAVTFKGVEVVPVLLEHGANVDMEDKKGRSPLQIASVRGYDEIVDLLSDHGAKGMFSLSTSSLCLPW
jgi:ankyrin repeat protein